MNEVVTPKDGPDLKALLQNNRNWAEKMQRENPEFFPTLAAQQKPKYLWIGCSDSRVPANQITGLLPGEIFVHRNVANIIRADDANCQSVVEFAVSALQVEHIIVCGHYQCGGVEAAMRGNIVGTVANWIDSISTIWSQQQSALSDLPEEERLSRLCELNVQHQLQSLTRSPAIQSAWANGQTLTLHGWIYSIKDGLLKDLGLTVSDQAGADALAE